MNWKELKMAGGCPVPWSEISTTTNGKWRMCCYANEFPDMSVKTHTALDVMTSERMNFIRRAMMNGDRSSYQPFCDRCIVMEQQGQTSRRQKRWEHMTDETAKVINQTEDDGIWPTTHFDHFDIKFTGNKCNLRCYMCHPAYSSGVAAEWNKAGWWNGPRHINPFLDMNEDEEAQWWQGFESALPHIQVLNFTGGEPFLMDEYWQILDFAIDSGYAKDMELHLSSNLTEIEYRGKSVRDYFNKFKRVHLQVSIDAFGIHYGWIRHPASYQAVIDNLTRFMYLDNVDLQVSTVVSALSIESLPSLMEHMDNIEVPHRFDNVLTDPAYMRVSSLPMDVKNRLRYNLTDPRCADLLKLFDEPENLTHWKQLVNHLDTLDNISRRDKWRTIFPLVGATP